MHGSQGTASPMTSTAAIFPWSFPHLTAIVAGSCGENLEPQLDATEPPWRFCRANKDRSESPLFFGKQCNMRNWKLRQFYHKKTTHMFFLSKPFKTYPPATLVSVDLNSLQLCFAPNRYTIVILNCWISQYQGTTFCSALPPPALYGSSQGPFVFKKKLRWIKLNKKNLVGLLYMYITLYIWSYDQIIMYIYICACYALNIMMYHKIIYQKYSILCIYCI